MFQRFSTTRRLKFGVIDILRLLLKTANENQHVVIITDWFLKFAWAVSKAKINSMQVVTLLLNVWMLPYEIPSYTLTCDGPQFLVRFCTNLWLFLQIKKLKNQQIIIRQTECTDWALWTSYSLKTVSVCIRKRERLGYMYPAGYIRLQYSGADSNKTLAVQQSFAKRAHIRHLIWLFNGTCFWYSKRQQLQCTKQRLLGRVTFMKIAVGRRIAGTHKEYDDDYDKKDHQEPQIRIGEAVYIDGPNMPMWV